MKWIVSLNFLKKSASRIAEEGVIGMIKGKKIVVPTKTWKIVVFLIKIVPQFIFDLLSRYFGSWKI